MKKIIEIKGTLCEIFPHWDNPNVVLRVMVKTHHGQGGIKVHTIGVQEPLNQTTPEPPLGPIKIIAEKINHRPREIPLMALSISTDVNMDSNMMMMDTLDALINVMTPKTPQSQEEFDDEVKRILAEGGIDLEEERKRMLEEEQLFNV